MTTTRSQGVPVPRTNARLWPRGYGRGILCERPVGELTHFAARPNRVPRLRGVHRRRPAGCPSGWLVAAATGISSAGARSAFYRWSGRLYHGVGSGRRSSRRSPSRTLTDNLAYQGVVTCEPCISRRARARTKATILEGTVERPMILLFLLPERRSSQRRSGHRDRPPMTLRGKYGAFVTWQLRSREHTRSFALLAPARRRACLVRRRSRAQACGRAAALLRAGARGRRHRPRHLRPVERLLRRPESRRHREGLHALRGPGLTDPSAARGRSVGSRCLPGFFPGFEAH